jgi:predicted MFS family arabinose efflux permease
MQNKESISQHTGRSLFTREFVLVFLAYFVFIAANYALIPTLPIYFTKLGSNARQVGVLVGVMAVAALVSRFFVGGVLTKYSEKSAMLFGTAFFALTFPAAIVFSHFWPLFSVRVFQGIAFACFHTAAFAYAVNIIPPAHRARGIAYFMLAPNLAMALAAPSGMFLFNQLGFTIFFLSCMSLSVCSFFLSWKIKGRKTIITPEQIFVFGALSAFFPLYAVECGVTNPGLFFTTTAVVMITGRVVGGRILDTYNKEKMLLTFIFISMVAMVILSFSKTLNMFILVGLLWGAGATFFMPACMAYALEYAGSSGGAAVGTYQAFVDLGMALGPVMMGLIIPLTGYPVAFLCLAFLCLINMCYFQFYVRRRNNVAATV